MIFFALTTTLAPKNSSPLTISDCIQAHAAILTTISTADMALGRNLHDMQRNKRIAIAIINEPATAPLLRLSFMGEEGLAYAHLLMDTLSRNNALRIGRTTCAIVDVTLNNGIWGGTSTWADLTAMSKGRRLRFWFATPTAITKRDMEGQRFSALLPEPLDIFMGLARRWQAMDGPSLPDDLGEYLKSGGCVISNYKLQTIEFRTSERTQIGFTGSVTYECRKTSQPHLAALQSLSRLAFFTGIGYQTARGMGLVHTSISE